MILLLVTLFFAVNALGLGASGGFSGSVYAPIIPEKDPQALLFQDPHRLSSSSYGRLTNERTSLTTLHQNNLNSSDDQNHVGVILLDPMRQHDIRDACEEIGESMISLSTIEEYKEDFLRLFSYLFYTGDQSEENERRLFYIRNGVLSVTKDGGHFDTYPFPSQNMQLPVLCTQKKNDSKDNGGKGIQRQLIRVASEGNTYVGSRDHKSFRFLGIPYADRPTRFSLARPYSEKYRTIHATDYGPRCAQVDGGSEDCLYLNIQTSYIPKKNSTAELRPVIFYIHGGGFTAGSGSDPVTDGGNLASREEIVVVTFNYRLSTLGFLAVPGTGIRGNYGIADQVLALEWTIKNIAQFGGDPRRITIIGEGAGATSVKVLLGSPPALGKFHGAIAMSDIGNTVGTGIWGDETSYSSYSSIPESYRMVGQRIFSEAGCDEGTTEQQLSCLREIPASTLVNLPTVAHHVVQDGKYVNTTKLNLVEKDAGTAHVPVIIGITNNEGTSTITYPSSNVQSELDGIEESLGINTTQALEILDSELFPSPNTGDVALDSFKISQQIATDIRLRCPNQASIFAGVSSGVFKPSYYYQMQRTIGSTHSNNLGGPSQSSRFQNEVLDHSSVLPFVFGNLDTIRDPLDLDAAQLISSYFAEFVRSGQPNPKVEYLAARDYQTTLDVVNAFDPWEPVRSPDGPIHILDFPSGRASFQDLEQCEFLGFPIGGW
ncbi:Alpha/Beta hydrolase protein [Aspergillus aurantiobrunneus]